MFITGRIAITVDGVTDEKDLHDGIDVMFIRPKMDYGTRNKVIGEAAKILQSQQKAKAGMSKRQRKQLAEQQKEQSGETGMQLNVGAYQSALLKYNILSWNGPSFAGWACTPENIEKLDPDAPLVAKVIEEISERNTDPDEEGDDPKDETKA